ncbi:hypothetical protein A3A93_05165 [Candidatus Roizmanbacteria bacterium RIFCSPLOWO2_01_FULL_38_12]|uniref:AB hydrolase-1 domain-containing protein n=1 Tax=Candidatus Roizmanbacteria bacterium RIFCSPLOWO2_01_FULL_38_12 TaxID=1802061 RepID=A0A1F7IQZ1_9BACT|nr:MAG: hypothetical protein A3F59_05370 [Candidatus Roizmanbacteria bacterium RIFCSPHIGHO2_12_FULL_38_13]OGK45779.1 MAG: hypothetical protein A3A93_05165 [Candidatus Roizmanbacteria bacterium RIFCSPLOWO2_01_FULL_38_12]
MQKKITSFDGTQINYSLSKNSENDAYLVFLHGLGGDLTAWKKELNFFKSKGISTLAVDLRGHGKSDRPDLLDKYKLEYFARDVKTIIDHEKIKKLIIVGHCFGGVVTIMFHKLFPNLAKSYILVDTTYKAPDKLEYLRKKHPYLINIMNLIVGNMNLRKKYFSHVDFSRFEGTSDYDMRRIYSDITNTTLKSWLFTFQTLGKFNGVKILKSMKKPVLVVVGQNDTIFDVLKAKKINSLVTGSELKIIPDANHIVVFNNPIELQNLIFKFVKKFPGFS